MFSNALQTQEQLKGQNEYYSVVAEGVMLDRVYSMRYKSYSGEGYIGKNTSKMFIDEYDDTPDSKCFLAYKGSKAIGSIRSCTYDPNNRLAMPIMEVFEKEIGEYIGYDDVLLEPNKFVVDPAFQRQGGMQSRFLLLGTAVEEAVRRKAANIVIAVRPSHIRFYKMFGGELISDEKSYPHLNFKTVLMVCRDPLACSEFIQRKVDIVERNHDSIPHYGNS